MVDPGFFNGGALTYFWPIFLKHSMKLEWN